MPGGCPGGPDRSSEGFQPTRSREGRTDEQNPAGGRPDPFPGGRQEAPGRARVPGAQGQARGPRERRPARPGDRKCRSDIPPKERILTRGRPVAILPARLWPVKCGMWGSIMDCPTARRTRSAITSATPRRCDSLHATAAFSGPEPSPVARRCLLPPGSADFRKTVGTDVSSRNRPTEKPRHKTRWCFRWAPKSTPPPPRSYRTGDGWMDTTRGCSAIRRWSTT